MKQSEIGEQQKGENTQPTVAQTGDGKVQPGAVIPTNNSMEKSGEGDRSDTEEMHRLNEDSGQ